MRSFRKDCKPEKLVYARRMRKAPTPAEAALWQILRKSKFKFHRQKIMFGWIVDFWCPSRSLVVEVDGGYHFEPEQLSYDRRRDRIIGERLQVRIIRVTNEDILKRPEETAKAIFEIAESQPHYGQIPKREILRG